MLVVSEAVWDLRFVNLIMHYIVVFCGIVAIYLNKRHGEMRLKQKMIFLISILRIMSSTIGYQYLIVQYTIVFQDTIAIPLNMCDSIENIKTKNVLTISVLTYVSSHTAH